MICSRCGKEIARDTLFVELSQSIKVLKITQEGEIECTSNVGDTTREFLCEDCFNAYYEKIIELEEENTQKKYVNMVEVIDDVQFGD